MTDVWNKFDKLLESWKENIDERIIEHRRKEKSCRIEHYSMSITSLILSSIVTSEFLISILNYYACDSSQGCDFINWSIILVTILSILNSILTGLQTFLNPQGMLEKHKSSRDKYSNLSRYIGAILATKDEKRDDPISIAKDIRNMFKEIEQDSPYIKSEKVELSLRTLRIKKKRKFKLRGTKEVSSARRLMEIQLMESE